MNNLCISCLSQEGLTDLEDNIELFEECTSIKVSFLKMNKTIICISCVEKCLSWKSFKQIALQSIKILSDTLETNVQCLNEEDDLTTKQSTIQLSSGEEEQEEATNEETDRLEIKLELNDRDTEVQKAGRSKWKLSCEFCNKWFRKEDMLKAHVRGTHLGQKPFVCKICKKEFNGRLSFRNHTFTHSSSSFDCETCGRSFNYPQLLSEHIKRTHMIQEKNYVCETCGKEFSKAQSLANHLVTHSNEKPFACETCSLRFKTQVYLNMHKLRHDGIRKFECLINECGKSFFTRSELSFHNRNVHGTNKPFQCQLCDKRYVKKSQLEAHTRTHSGARPYICDFPDCTKAFTSASHRKTHRLIHTGEKPHLCVVCKRCFRKSSTLKVHLKIHKPTSV